MPMVRLPPQPEYVAVEIKKFSDKDTFTSFLLSAQTPTLDCVLVQVEVRGQHLSNYPLTF